jgi:ATP-binding cassette subfamily F protein 2
MPPSASKQKRLAEKAAKHSAKGSTNASSTAGSKTGSKNGSAIGTPLTSLSAATSQEDVTSMAKLQIATDRYY